MNLLFQSPPLPVSPAVTSRPDSSMPPLSSTYSMDNTARKKGVDSLQTSMVSLETPPIELAMDGGRAAWLSMLGGFIVAFCTFGSSSAFGVFQDLYTLQGTATPSRISWIGSLQFFLTFAVGLPAGRLLDAGYFHHTQIAGVLLCVFSQFMLSLVDTKKYWQLILSQGLATGIGCGLLFVPVLSLQAHHWSKRKSFALGMVLAGTSCGGVVYPIMLNHLIHGRVGFAWGVRASAFMTLALLVIAQLCMSTRTVYIKASLAKRIPSKDSVPIWRDYACWIAIFGGMLSILGLYIPYFYLQLFVNVHGMSSNLAVYSIPILNGASFFGRIALNIAADHVGQFNTLCPVAIVSTALSFVMLAATTPAKVVVFAILYGFISGGFVSLMPGVLVILSRDLSEVGIRVGLGFFLAGLGLLFGSPIAGGLINPGFHWGKMIVFTGVVMAAGSVLLLVARAMTVKRKGTQYT